MIIIIYGRISQQNIERKKLDTEAYILCDYICICVYIKTSPPQKDMHVEVRTAVTLTGTCKQ